METPVNDVKIVTLDVAKRLIEIGDNAQAHAPKIVELMREFVLTIFKDLKQILPVKPSKEQFLKIIADYIDIKYVSSNILIEMIDGVVILEALKLVDKMVTKMHADWYDDLWRALESVETKVVPADAGAPSASV